MKIETWQIVLALFSAFNAGVLITAYVKSKRQK